MTMHKTPKNRVSRPDAQPVSPVPPSTPLPANSQPKKVKVDPNNEPSVHPGEMLEDHKFTQT